MTYKLLNGYNGINTKIIKLEEIKIFMIKSFKLVQRDWERYLIAFLLWKDKILMPLFCGVRIFCVLRGFVKTNEEENNRYG